ncbi:tyrosine-type recombinase/integrase [Kitasatospora sp. NPDC001527]|uniref:tyrosine-type recombinase/integrase n=1 Tax=Kitasatospora sp. NPDC001527 TaxID=3154519 RepID=UPI00332A4FD5
MARVWIEDRSTQKDYIAAMEKWRAAKRAGSKRAAPGRWRVRWYDPNGDPKAKTFGTLPAAEKHQQDTLDRLDKGTYRDPKQGKTLFSEVAAGWFGALRRPGERTRDDYRELLDLYVLPKWGTWPVASIRWENVSEWLTELCNAPGKRGKPLSPARIAKIHLVFGMVLKYAVRTGKIATSPAVDHELPQDEDDDDHVYLTHDQLEALAAAAGEYALLMLVLAYCGIRWGEVSALKAGRVQASTRRLRIVQAYTRKRGGGLLLKDVKNHEKRSVPLLGSLVADLRDALKGKGRDALLFTGRDGEPMGYWEFRSAIFDPAVKAAGLDGLGLTPHKLRHTAASLAIAAGADVKVVQQMLGHKSAAMTLDVYGHLFPDRLDEVANALDAGRASALAARTALAA